MTRPCVKCVETMQATEGTRPTLTTPASISSGRSAPPKGSRAAVVALATVVASLAAGTVSPVLAQDGDEPPGSWARVRATPAASVSTLAGDASSLWHRTTGRMKDTWSGGQRDLLVSGYIWHAPWKYSDEQRARYNAAAWGLGYGRTTVDDANHARTLLGMVSADSFDRAQYMVAYLWRARWRPSGGALNLGGGYAALVIGRSDKLHYAPLPLALPVASLGTDRLEVLAAYVPGYDVAYFFTKVRLH